MATPEDEGWGVGDVCKAEVDHAYTAENDEEISLEVADIIAVEFKSEASGCALLTYLTILNTVRLELCSESSTIRTFRYLSTGGGLEQIRERGKRECFLEIL